MLRMRSLPFQLLNLPMLVLCAVLSGSVNPPMAVSQPKSLSWSSPTEMQKEDSAENKEIPCLNSSERCVEQLTELAIANSFKLQQSADRIALIEQRLAVTEERIDYTSKKRWTNYISTNPVNIIQNLFGGGGVQRDNIAIASLEIRTTDLIMLSNNIATIAVFAGVSSAILSSIIDSIFTTFVIKKQTETVREIIKKSLLLGCTGGLLVSIIFCYYASISTAPIRMIIIYSIIIGIAGPILSNLLMFGYFRLFARS